MEAADFGPDNVQINSGNVRRGKLGVDTMSSVHDVLGLFNRGYSVDKIAAILKIPLTHVYASIAGIAENEYRRMLQ